MFSLGTGVHCMLDVIDEVPKVSLRKVYSYVRRTKGSTQWNLFGKGERPEVKGIDIVLLQPRNIYET